MSYIEGIGDEVTILFLVLILIVVLLLLWVSTSVSDRQLIRVVVLDGTRFQEFLRRFTRLSNRGDTNNRQLPAPDSSPAEGASESQDGNGAKRDPSPSQLFDSPQIEPIRVSKAETGETATVDQSAVTSNNSDLSAKSPITEIDENTSSLDTESVPRDSEGHSSTSENDKPVKVESTNSDKNTEKTTVDTDSTGGGQHVTQDSTDTPETSSASAEFSAADAQNITEEEILQDGHIRIRLKYLDERQKLVQAKPEETIGQFKRKHFSMEMADNFAVRFVFRGQELREDRSTLQAYHVEDNSVIHCLMSRINQSEQPTHQHQHQGLDLGFLMFPLFALILGLIWYCRFTYRNYFSAMSTLSLIGITFLYFVALLASFRPGVHEHND